MDMSAYFERFERMVESLATRSSRPTVTNFMLYPPATKEALAMVSTLFKGRPPQALVDFFAVTNGLQLRWQFAEGHSKLPPQEKGFAWDLPWKEPINDIGFVNILPLEKIFLNDWKGFTWFEHNEGETKSFLGKTYSDNKFRLATKPFDIFSSANTMCFFIGDESDQDIVFRADDSFADNFSSKISSFETYLEAILSTAGSVEKRSKLYDDKWNSSQSRKRKMTLAAR